jgi:hypothetical protein
MTALQWISAIGAIFTLQVAVITWVLAISRTLHRQDSRIQELESTRIRSGDFSVAIGSLRDMLSAQVERLRDQIHDLTVTVGQLVDREGGVSYPPSWTQGQRKP